MSGRRRSYLDSDNDDALQQDDNAVTTPSKRRKTTDDRSIISRESSLGNGNASIEEDDAGSDNEEEVDNASIPQHQQRSASRLTTCAEAGVIESVTLVDFMCHENLSIDLAPNMNFIIGHNGSGKSAILTAITVCLGGKAAISGRGSSLKSFVRNGRTQATVVIKLKNKGPDAYNHDVYGDSIIIERKFGAEGGGTYTIKGADRQIHARRREDLDAITDHFGLAIENPMNVLSQDTARQFLANATPRTLYDLFMKGIELQQLEADHNLLSENIESTSATLVARGRSLEKLKEQEAEASKIYDETHRAREAQDEFDSMKDKMAWIQVRDVERHRDEVQKKVAREEGHLMTLDERLESASGSVNETRSAIAEVESEMTNMTTTERGPIEARYKEKKGLFDEGKSELQRFQTDQRECHTHIKRQDKTIDETRKAIDREIAALAENEAGAQKQRLLQEKSDLDEKLGSLRDELGDIEAQYQDNGLDITAKRKEIADTEQELSGLERSVDSSNERMNGLRRATNDVLSAFHQNMERLLKAIDQCSQNGRWREKPIGPMGRTMTLRFPEWSDIVENFWGARINGFLVSNYEDKKLLLRLMNDHNIRGCPVLQGSDTTFKIDEPEDRFLTVLRAIEWSNDRVKRQLIITNHPESALLIRERREAELTMDPMNPPLNAVRAFAIDPEDPTRGYVIGGGARGSSMQQTTNPYRRPKRLTRSSEADIEQSKAALAAANEKVRSMKEVHRLLKANLRQLEEQKTGLHNRRAESLKLQQRYTKQLQKIKDDLETTQVVDDGTLQGRNQSLLAAIQQKETYEAQYRTILSEKAIVEARQQDLKAELLAINQELDGFDEKLRALEPRLTELTTELVELNGKVQHFQRQVAEHNEKKREYEDKLAEANATVDEYTQIAAQICDRVEIDEKETTKRLSRILEDKQKAIVRIRQRYGGATEAQIASRLQSARENLKVASEEVRELSDIIEGLQTALVRRQESRKKFQKLVCMRAKQNFVRHLSERDFAGRLSFKHDVKELHTHVVPADVQANTKGSKMKRGSDNKVLSGGEKSFTTICLLLSIWEAMGCPIRALDEFDVFMDSVNRGISMKMMIDSANDSIDKQFIVITPQDMGGVKPTPTTKIHKLADPTRGVTVAS